MILLNYISWEQEIPFFQNEPIKLQKNKIRPRDEFESQRGENIGTWAQDDLAAEFSSHF